MSGKVKDSRRPIVVVGSINFDLVARTSRVPLAGETLLGEEFQMHPGGKGANQAVAIARLGYPVRMIGRLGSDVFGERLHSDLTVSGVDVEGVEEVDGASGVAVIVVGSTGENSIVVTPGANALVSPEYIVRHAELLRGAALVLTQLEIPLETVERVAELCHSFRVPLMLDPAPSQWLPPELMKRISWFTPNQTEAAYYIAKPNGHRTPSGIAQALLSAGPQGVILKLGARGAHLATGDSDLGVDAIQVKAVDTTAAGDAFNGAFAVALQMGKSAAESTKFAVAAAAISVTRPGAQPSMPTMEEVVSLLNRENTQSSLEGRVS